MTTGIYKITNLVNGKVYIGASKSIEKRWYNHKCSVSSPIHSDLETYGLENFKFEVLLECPETMLAQWERDMICLYDSDDPEKGYNSQKDRPYSLKNSESHRGKPAWNRGKPAWNKGIPWSEESKRRMSESHKGYKHTDEARHKMKGRKAWNRGTPLSEETRRKISEKTKEYWRKKKEV